MQAAPTATVGYLGTKYVGWLARRNAFEVLVNNANYSIGRDE